ncbi:MAG: DUF1963 domain-containing protein [Okeania sp. SIO3B5]|uniref:DUF1963 domain-containing protein n=1 Tax=Okeania sp. SIO3B5 TaxID=2607811 RepID=UPI0014017661|nr:DUF1963 domain-containing protein [Okeania sp. SIO3B5]NEO53021.1 DUF1963 domain-containing protein [Okeania sp. SIO3B5]
MRLKSDLAKFAGKPWLGKNEEWPKCPYCQNPLEFFFQLNLNQLPESLQNKFGSGILQMFYCTYTNVYGDEVCEIDYEGCEAFSDIHFLRIIQPETEAQDVEIPEIEDISPPKLIVDWEQLEDYPDFEEAKKIGIKLAFDEYYLYPDKYPIQ